MSCLVDIWFVDLAGAPALADCRLGLLRDDERLRLGGYLAGAPARRFALARLALRIILAGRSGEEAGAVLIGDDLRGKPRRVDGLGGSFNVSHSGDTVAIAVCDTHEVGIDVEQHASFDAPERMWKFACSPAERDWLAAHPHEATEQFGRLWTRKEALLKAVGLGLRLRPSSLDLADQIADDEGVATLPGPLPGMVARARWRSLRRAAGCHATVAALVTDATVPLDVRLHDFEPAQFAR